MSSLFSRFWFQLIMSLLLFAGMTVFYGFTQPEISIFDGKGWDGEAYFNMAVQFSQGEAISERGPFAFRPGLPWLVGQFFAENIMQGFRFFNLLAGFLIIPSLLIWFRFFIKKPWIIFSLLAFVLLTWISPLRYTIFYPCYTDAWGMLFCLFALIFLEQERRSGNRIWIIPLSISIGLGILFREYVFLVALIYPMINNPLNINPKDDESFGKKLSGLIRTGSPEKIGFLNNNFKWSGVLWSLVPIGAGVLAFVWVRLQIEGVTNEFGFAYMAALWMFFKSLFAYLHAWMIVVGPALVLLLYFRKQVRMFYAKHQALALFLILGSALAYFGGADTERFIFWLMPAWIIPIGIIMERNASQIKGFLFWVLLLPGQVLAGRYFLPIPDSTENFVADPFPLITPLGKADSLQLFSHHANTGFRFFSFFQIFFLLVILYMVLLRKGPKDEFASSEQS